ncbi:MAG: Gfo/Idh/MocA family protein [Phycisphaerales bacterium]
MSHRDGKTIRVGVIGLGFMGQHHIRAYRAAHAAGYPVEVVAVCDRNPDRRTGLPSADGNIGADNEGHLFDPDHVRGYAEASELFADKEVDLVSICTHTETHPELAIKALRAEKHALVEKPLAVTVADARRVADVAASANRLCMPAMCMRFWPGWSWLRDRVQENTYGAVLGATFHRLGSPPAWASDFYGDSTRSGGALVDLHIHDADFVRWMFGDPDSVVSAGSINHLTTLYRYDQGPGHVVAEGGWGHASGFPFKMRYVVSFEDATADFDLGRDPKLLLTRDGTTEPVEIEDGTGYDHEIRHMLDAIRDGRHELRATVHDAVNVARLLDAERRSLETGEIVDLHSR